MTQDEFVNYWVDVSSKCHPKHPSLSKTHVSFSKKLYDIKIIILLSYNNGENSILNFPFNDEIFYSVFNDVDILFIAFYPN